MFTLDAGKTLAASGPTAVNFFLFGDEVTTTDAFKIANKGSLSVAATVIYTATGVQALLKTLEFFNTAGTPSTIFLYANGTATTDRFFTATIPAGGTLTYGAAGWQLTDATGTTLVAATPITASGDATGTQVGSNIALTLSSFGPGAVGPIGSATQVAAVSTDAKGRVSALSAVSIQIAESQVTNLVSDLAGKAPSGNYITGLNGDVSAVGPGSATATLATFGPGAIGPIGSATQVAAVSTDAKGRVSVLSAVAIQAATVSQPGFLTAAGFKKLNNIWVDMAAEYGFVGDDATLNDAAWTAFLASPPPAFSTIFFPVGTYRFANEITLNQDKRWRFKGGGAQNTYIKTTSATANLFNFNVAGFYTTWEDLGFLSVPTKTAGAAIAITGGNNAGTDVRRCSFSGMFIGIDAQGANSANLSVWDSLNYASPPANGRMLRINGSSINVVVSNSTSNCGAAGAAIAGTANVEVNQSGAVQIFGCDLIGAVNSLLLNANQGGGTSIAAIYVDNTFFDQSGGSTVKITGANTADRIKFTQCGIAAGLIGTPAFEVAGTGAGAVGTATAMPAGISLIDCDIYYAPGASTSSGILINGCQDINIQNTRIAGFSGVGGSGVHVIPSAANQTRVRVNGCRIGPNSNLTINNLIGIQLDVGASGLGALSITDNDIAGNGTAISDSSTIAAGSSKFINNNLGASAGLSATLFAPGGTALTATEAIIAQIALPANSCKVGTTFSFIMNGISTATAMQVKLHIGPLGTIADPAVIATAATLAGTAGGLDVSGSAQISVVGATAGGSGSARVSAGTVTNTTVVTATGTFNSAVANFATLGAIGAAGGHTVRAATMTVTGPA